MSPARLLVQLARMTLVMVLTIAVGSCASMSGQGSGTPLQPARAKLKKGRIEVWIDRANRCRTRTTPYFQVKNSDKAVWDIDKHADCDFEIEIKFDKGDNDPLSAVEAECKRKGKEKIECEINDVTGRFEYSVTINGNVEDPEIEIVM